MTLNKRLHELENNILAKPEMGSTRFCTCDLPEAEQVLLEKARRFALMEIPFEEATEAQKTILYKASEIMNFRIFDLFTAYLEGLLCKNDKIARIVLHERFLWFIRELREEIRQNLEVSELEKNTPEDSEVDVVDQYFRKAPEVFTEESYEKLSTEIMLELIKAKELTELSKKGKPNYDC